MTPASILLLGESPPPKAPPDFRPFDCASGDNLARFLGLRGRAVVLDHLPRANCFDVPTGVGDSTPPWDDGVAAANAAAVLASVAPRVVVALGRRPCDALGLPPGFPPLAWARVGGRDVLHVPHPSGRSTSLNTEAKRHEARWALLPEVVLGCPTLRPWHFRLDEPEVLADLGAALCPLRPALGVAAAVITAEAHTAAGSGRPKALQRLAVLDEPLRVIAERLAGISAGAKVPLDGTLFKRERNALRTMPDALALPPAVVRAIYGRHVALGVA